VYDHELRKAGLRVTQHHVLSVLNREGPIGQGDLAGVTGLDETTLSRGVALLEAKGWVEARPGADRRERRLSLTDEGRARLEAARPAWTRAQERLRESLEPSTWDAIHAGLAELVQALDDGAENQERR
jgi:DNA-binding MarR family transcriptional regulator